MGQARRFEVWSAVLALAALCCVPAWGQAAKPEEPAAEVTFYSSGDIPKAEIDRYYSRFFGPIMDEDAKLGRLGRNRFVTFRMTPGEHTFSAHSWNIPTRAGIGHLEMNLEAERHYFVSIYFQATRVFRAGMSERTCRQAKIENPKTKPLEAKHLTEYGAARVVAEKSFPACL